MIYPGGTRTYSHFAQYRRPLKPIASFSIGGALEPVGCSVLRLEKRPRLTVGRPAKNASVRGAIRDALEVVAYPNEVGAEIERLEKSQPRQAVGVAIPDPAVIEKAIRNVCAKLKIGRTKMRELMKAANCGDKALKNKKK